jgi:hypothetical protein
MSATTKSRPAGYALHARDGDAAAHATITLAMSTEAIGAERRTDGSDGSAFSLPRPRRVTD